jgi:hypothetical protein
VLIIRDTGSSGRYGFDTSSLYKQTCTPPAASALAAMGILFGSLITPMTPQLTAPRHVSSKMVKKWAHNQINFADTLCYADNDPKMLTEFVPGEHFGYNAGVLFREEREPAELAISAYERWKAPNAERGKDAQQAYDDFLRGLEVAGMQETFDSKSVAPPGMKDDERRDILDKIITQLTGKPACKINISFSRRDLEDLAQWERYVVLRRDAPLRRKWYADLHNRATSMMMDTDSDSERKFTSKPLIRTNTFKLLERRKDEPNRSSHAHSHAENGYT